MILWYTTLGCEIEKAVTETPMIMPLHNLLLSVSALVAASLAHPVAAQPFQIDQAALATACGQGGCAAQVSAQIAQMRAAGLDAAALNSGLGQLAAVLIAAAQAAPQDTVADYAEALAVVANASTEPAQAAAIAAAAQAVANNAAATIDLETGVAASAG